MGNAAGCATRYNLNYEDIKACYRDKGSYLEHEMSEKTRMLNPPHEYVPWITVNDQHNDDIQNEAQDNLVAYLCRLWMGINPADPNTPKACTALEGTTTRGGNIAPFSGKNVCYRDE